MPVDPAARSVREMTPTVPFDRDGKFHGHLRLPYSRDDSAWGHVMIPICVVRNGDGPTALVTGGNHGDEYEGPIAVTEFAHSVNPADVSGRVILIPGLNAPALAAGRRTSPIDGGNMNRSFPGDPRGTVTQKIAAWVVNTLLPMADIVLDFHSGGRTLDFLPFAASHVLPDRAQDAACAAAARAFGAPWTVRMLEIDDSGMFDGAAERAGKVFVTTELGGAGMARPKTVAIARRGLRNVLIHGDILAGEIAAAETRSLDMPDDACFTFAETAGMMEPLVPLGAEVAEGQELALVWPIEATGRDPAPLRAGRAGLLTARHVPGLIQPGDCAAVVAVPV
ncbi:N-alpha-acetyl diaminobutyric acid deacetylase DoeB [Rhodobacterales bacterium HKCCE2091]|nr:N-alpha-acetyl diaminobutyric acid deacetylase DoeB [Rhodobacterales bacterium HKCCE2091]